MSRIAPCRATLIDGLRLVLPYPADWYDGQSDHVLSGMYADRYASIQRARVERANRHDDRRTLHELRLRAGV